MIQAQQLDWVTALSMRGGKVDWRTVSRELHGEERDRVIREHLESISEPRRTERTEDYPLARWVSQYEAELARKRAEAVGYYRNSKPRPRGRR